MKSHIFSGNSILMSCHVQWCDHTDRGVCCSAREPQSVHYEGPQSALRGGGGSSRLWPPFGEGPK